MQKQVSIANYNTNFCVYSYPFGMLMPGRTSPLNTVDAGGHRYGFQGQESDDEVKGKGNSVNYKYRMHDPRTGRFFAVDPLAGEYPHNGPYNFSENMVIHAIELEGLEAFAIHGMGSMPEHYQNPELKQEGDGADFGKNYKMMNAVYKNYTNNSALDAGFAWNLPRKIGEPTAKKGGKIMSRKLQKIEDREIAAKMLVTYVLNTRKKMIDEGVITESEDITLIGFSAGGLVARMAAQMLYEKTGNKVNIITINAPAPKKESMPGHPCGIEANDQIIMETEGDGLRQLLLGDYETNVQSSPDNVQHVILQSKVKRGILGWLNRHMAKNIDIDQMKGQNIERLEPMKKSKSPNSPKSRPKF